MAVDTSSRTSAALVRVLLRERLGHDPEYAPMPPDVPIMLNSADAALVIGDPALYYDGDAARLDLGEEWTGAHRPAVRVRLLGGPAGRGRRRRTCARLQSALAAGLGRARPDRLVL